MRVLGIDPGDHTGLSIVDFEDDGVRILATQMVMFDDPRFSPLLHEILVELNPDHVAVEDFAIVPGRAHVFQGNKMQVTRVIGRVTEIAEREGKDIVFVRPVERKWLNETKMGMLGLRTKFSTAHERDATYVALYAAYFKFGRQFGIDVLRSSADEAGRTEAIKARSTGRNEAEQMGEQEQVLAGGTRTVRATGSG